MTMTIPAIMPLTVLPLSFVPATAVAAIACVLVVLSCYDIRERRLPNRLVLVVAGAAVLYIAALAVQAGERQLLLAIPTGWVAAVVIAVAVNVVSRLRRHAAGIGAGDIKLLAALGPVFGIHAFWLLPVASVLSVPYVVAVVVRMVISARRNRRAGQGQQDSGNAQPDENAVSMTGTDTKSDTETDRTRFALGPFIAIAFFVLLFAGWWFYHQYPYQ
jgi:leader peptidase (prepilin peptidase)/N-methyltransferase